MKQTRGMDISLKRVAELFAEPYRPDAPLPKRPPARPSAAELVESEKKSAADRLREDYARRTAQEEEAAEPSPAARRSPRTSKRGR